MLLKWMNPGEPIMLSASIPSKILKRYISISFMNNTNDELYCISSKGSLSYHTPDFSKVEPKVRFPKAGYKPPKSRRSFKRDSLSPEPPLVFKSPADIVKEVLLNIPDGSPAPQDSHTLQASAPDFTVPQEFRSPRHATALLEQLQVRVETETKSSPLSNHLGNTPRELFNTRPLSK